MKHISFPEGFLWGAATSSHQVEGNNRNNWTEWEKANAERLAQEARGHWQSERFPEMLTPQNYISGKAADHYSRFEDDFAIAASLGHNAHRFSLEWSRIEPEEGVFDEIEIEHYRRVINALRSRGLEPVVTLWHFTLPVWFAQRGGWEWRGAPEAFARYTEAVVSAFGSDVRFWITHNEPEVFLSGTYLKGTYPPGRKSPFSYMPAFRNLVRAHERAYAIVKRVVPKSQIGIAKHIVPVAPLPALGWWWNRKFLARVSSSLDFIGVNYYRSSRFLGGKESRFSDLGWKLEPKDTILALREAARFDLPLFVTENGLADADDTYRAWFIQETLKSIRQAIEEGIDVRGYFHWSLLDNFEWDKGFWPRFGLVEINYQTQERRVRNSTIIYKNMCKADGLDARKNAGTFS